MTDICDFKECKRNKFKGKDKCILHCAKGKVENDSYSEDFRNGIIHQFNNALIEYIVDSIASPHFGLRGGYTKNQIRNYLKSEGVEGFDISLAPVVFNNISFPARKNQDGTADYIRSLEKLNDIHFNYCEFSTCRLNLEKIPVYFQDCVFHDTWTQGKFTILKNVSNSLHQNSVFKKEVSVNASDDGFVDFSSIEGCFFAGCTFNADLTFSAVKINQIFAKDLLNSGGSTINFLSFYNSIVEAEISLDGSTIKGIQLSESEFLDFHFHHQELDFFCIDNCTFKGRFSVRASEFKVYEIRNSVFEEFTEFDSCIFGEENNDDEQSGFSYITFNGFSDFRNTQFSRGLNLETLKAKEPPNFLNINLLSNNNSRETLRIIKYSFDRIGNTIEANKFFALEMAKHYESLQNRKWHDSEKILFKINNFISKFGESYVRPLVLLGSSMLVFYMIYYIDCNNLIFKHLNFAYPSVSVANNALNVLAKSIMPFSKFLPEKREFIGLLFYLIQAPLIWQTLVAIKRKTKR